MSAIRYPRPAVSERSAEASGPSCASGKTAAMACVAESYTRNLVMEKGSSRSSSGVSAEYRSPIPPSS